jgi:HK97 family phage major capsid protein
MTTENKIGKEELKSLILETVSEKIEASVEKSVAPFKEQTSDWMKKINATSRDKDVIEKGTKGIGAGRIVRALAAGKGDPARAAKFAAKAWNDDLGDMIVKSLQAQDFDQAGALIPPTLEAEVIEYLRARVVVRAAGGRNVPLTNGTATFRKQTGTISAAYVGESQDIGITQPAVGQITLTARKLAAIVPISNDLLLYDASPAADAFVRDDLVSSIAVKEDVTFLYGVGTSDTPKGIRYWANAANVTNSNGTTATQIEADFKDLLNALQTNNVPMRTPVFFMNPKAKNTLANLRDANGNLIYPETRGANPTVYGFPIFTSTSIPTNTGNGSQTEVIFADMSEVLIGDASGLAISMDSAASYVESGSLVSAFSRDETLIRAIARHDLGVRHDLSIAVKAAVGWA